ncbi:MULTISPECIES: BON domain-containing protein [Streptomyces]|uniref:BON domain-containing protein n=1 Tax=Streptomyces TaxID=1883 RepID=UPI000C368D30|nr:MULTISPECIES: BON domain-containing protein [Streptomyces]PIB11989.1 hypothetical protein B1C81_01985 [Streptomyces sp. HG99]
MPRHGTSPGAGADKRVGIVTRRDLPQARRPDPEIHHRVIAEMVVDTLGLVPDAVDVHVVDGVVTLEGHLEKDSQISILLPLAEHVDGVVSVVDRLTARSTIPA